MAVLKCRDPQRQAGAPYMIITTFHPMTGQACAARGAHELVISREGSALELKRWSSRSQTSKLWAVLYFITWEGAISRRGLRS